MAAPGTAAVRDMQQVQATHASRPGGIPASFQGPVNMPNINFSAPIIRLGTGPMKAGNMAGDRGTNGQDLMRRSGIGAERAMDPRGQLMRDNMMSLVPPTSDEIVRTIFVGGIPNTAGSDLVVERILSSPGRLRRWDRAVDATGKTCSFGFAQYDDAESLSNAVEVLKNIEIPTQKQPIKGDASVEKKDGQEDIEKSKLLILVDDNSLKYLEQWETDRDEDPAEKQSRLTTARLALEFAIQDAFNPRQQLGEEQRETDSVMQESHGDVEVVNINIAADDELADIPAEMRETVAKEIAAFRDRSVRRDIERLRREEEMEAAERNRNGANSVSSPARGHGGPSAGSNNIPLGPRGSASEAPSGPRNLQPRDYQNEISFVNGSGTNGNANGAAYISRADDDSEASDEELERRRKEKQAREQGKRFLDQERRWLNRERSRAAALEREMHRDGEEAANLIKKKEKMLSRLRDWNDGKEADRKSDDYYKDHSLWARNRATYRQREAAADDADRAEEQRETERSMAGKEQARSMADSFLDRHAEEISLQHGKIGATPQQPFKLSLGAAAQKAQKATTARRTVAEVEGLLEDEEDDTQTTRRTLVPIKYDPLADAANMNDEEREQAVKDLAAKIPTDKEGLWSWEVKWQSIGPTVIAEKLRPFVERKIVEYLGVQEQLLVEVVEENLGKRAKPQELVEVLEGVSLGSLESSTLLPAVC
jgi:DNA uptake protein ComE-like DNA-binding protein